MKDMLWAPNHDRTRWFLVLTTHQPQYDELNRLLECCNSVCAEFELPTLYTSQRSSTTKKASAQPLRPISAGITHTDEADDHFHFSIGWQLCAPSNSKTTFHGIDPDCLESVKNLRAEFSAVKVKIGNTISSLSLQRDDHDSSSRLD